MVLGNPPGMEVTVDDFTDERVRAAFAAVEGQLGTVAPGTPLDPALIEDVARDFPDLTIVLAHGGRGWWYDAAAFMTLMRENVWIEVSGLPPKRLPDYYEHFDFERLARKMIFGTDWPGVPGPRANAKDVLDLGLDRPTTERMLYKNALEVYALDAERLESAPAGKDIDTGTT